MAKSTVSMKLSIDSRGKRVVFAEADKECVDFLFQILSLLVATIISLLGAKGMKGSLPNIYKSLGDLNDTYIQPNQNKDTFLKPASSCSIPLLGLEDKSTFDCDYCRYTGHSVDPRVCPNCRRQKGRLYPAGSYSDDDDDADDNYVVPPSAGLVKGEVKYMVMDNLMIQPMSTITAITLLNKFYVTEVGALEEKVVNLGMKEAVKLLKASLKSNNVLTDVFC